MSHVTLASNYDPYIHGTDLSGYLYSPKIDGMRCWWCVKTQELFTRNHNKIKIPKKWKNLLKELNLPFDGELYIENFSTTMSVCRNKKCDPSEWENVKFFVFDLIIDTIPFLERYYKLQEIFENLDKVCQPDNNFLTHLKQFTLSKTSNITEKRDKFINQGFEGIMLRKMDSVYEHTRSTHWLLKVKKFHTEEGKVTGYQKGDSDGKYSHCMGTLLIQTEKGIDVMVGSGFNDYQRNNYKLDFPIGSVVEFRYFEKNNDKYRFPTFVRKRPDKTI